MSPLLNSNSAADILPVASVTTSMRSPFDQRFESLDRSVHALPCRSGNYASRRAPKYRSSSAEHRARAPL